MHHISVVNMRSFRPYPFRVDNLFLMELGKKGEQTHKYSDTSVLSLRMNAQNKNLKTCTALNTSPHLRICTAHECCGDGIISETSQR